MNDNGLIAVGVLTYNHPNTIEDVLNNCAEYYYKYGVDIYFYDSSQNDDTKQIVEKYISKGYDNLTYIRMDTEKYLPGEKTEYILSQGEMKKDYKYVWPTKDRAYVTEEVLSKIVKYAEESYDIINVSNILGKEVIDDPVEFYYTYGAISTSININLYNTQTLLSTYKYEYVKYTKSDYLYFFVHFFLLFDKLAALESPRIRIVDSSNGGVKMSACSGTEWTKEVFNIWKDRWIEVNDALPSIYDCAKDSVIKLTAGLPWILADRSRLMELKSKDILNESVLGEVAKGWERISDIPFYIVEDIAKGIYDPLYDLSQVQKISEKIGLLVEMQRYIKDGKLSCEEVPIDDIGTLIFERINEKYSDNDSCRNVVLGALQSILAQMKECTGKELMAQLLHQIIAYML